ncbi:hypothetical protein P7C70_g6380, partial [Phenoliferia sp. Uapishka_3]
MFLSKHPSLLFQHVKYCSPSRSKRSSTCVTLRSIEVLKAFPPSLFYPSHIFHSEHTLPNPTPTYSNMSNTNTNEPSKVNANINSAIGSVKETVGNVAGSTDLEASGASQKREADAEYKAAQAEGYVEGAKDRIGGKVDNVVGAVTGDSQKELSGKARHETGQVQQEINKP